MPWAGVSAPLSLSFFICKMGMPLDFPGSIGLSMGTVPGLQGVPMDVKERLRGLGPRRMVQVDSWPRSGSCRTPPAPPTISVTVLQGHLVTLKVIIAFTEKLEKRKHTGKNYPSPTSPPPRHTHGLSLVSCHPLPLQSHPGVVLLFVPCGFHQDPVLFVPQVMMMFRVTFKGLGPALISPHVVPDLPLG